MLKQFNPELLSFRDPTTKEDGWFDVATQDDIIGRTEHTL